MVGLLIFVNFKARMYACVFKRKRVFKILPPNYVVLILYIKLIQKWFQADTHKLRCLTLNLINISAVIKYLYIMSVCIFLQDNHHCGLQHGPD